MKNRLFIAIIATGLLASSYVLAAINDESLSMNDSNAMVQGFNEQESQDDVGNKDMAISRDGETLGEED